MHVLNRQFRSIASHQVAYPDITCGVPRAGCRCSSTFRTTIPGVKSEARYDDEVRPAALGRIRERGRER